MGNRYFLQRQAPERFGPQLLERARQAARDGSGSSARTLGARAELRMNLAWSYLHLESPNLPAAGREAAIALTLVPDWHYLRNLLMPQIRSALAATPPSAAPSAR